MKFLNWRKYASNQSRRNGQPQGRACMTERWRKIHGFESYEVSDSGNVRSWRSKNGRGVATKPHALKLTPFKDKPYLRVRLYDSTSTAHCRRVHHLVLEAFVGPCPLGMQGCHGDGNAANNALTNLRWGTPQENADDRVSHGTQVRGETVGKAVLTDEQVEKIKATIDSGKWKHGTGRSFALEFGVSDSAISSIKRKKTWSHV